MPYIKKSYIDCIYCNQKAPLKTEPIYDGSFKKTGEKFICGFCKKEYEKEKVPFVQEKKPERDKRTVDETCANCENFVKNIFYQKCTKKNEHVNVYDSCDDFAPKKEKKKELPF